MSLLDPSQNTGAQKLCVSKGGLSLCQIYLNGSNSEGKGVWKSGFGPRAFGDRPLKFDSDQPYTDLISDASNKFSSNIYDKLSSDSTSPNQLFCSLSLHVALGLLLQGAAGQTAQELDKALQLDGTDRRTVKAAYKHTFKLLQDKSLKIVSTLYASKGLGIKSSYKQEARKIFLADIENIDYSNPDKAAKVINKYVEDHTDNKIHHIIDPSKINKDTALVVVNAVYFKATWKIPFKKVHDDYFTVSNFKKIPVKMMYQNAVYEYKYDPVLNASILKLDYENDDYSMIIILPKKLDGLPSVEAELAKTSLDSILNGLRQVTMAINIPKFRIEKSMDVKNALIELGILELFTPGADLSGIVSEGGLWVSDVIQKTFIEVDEKGTEAGAVTAIGHVALSLKPSFHADHPFHFMIIKGKTSSIVFSGRLVLPQ